MEHTPGKWFFQNNTADDREGFEVLSDDGRSKWFAVADVMPNHFGTEEVSLEQAEANARLIAAAPDLLAALESMVNAYNEHSRDFTDTVTFDYYMERNGGIDRVLDVIAKAKGGAV